MRSEEREFVANKLLYSSAWSCRTGKRIKSSLKKARTDTHRTKKKDNNKANNTTLIQFTKHSVSRASPEPKVEENPALKRAHDKERKKKSNNKVEQIFRTRA